MGIVKVLKRKDGATVVVAVALGFAIANFMINITTQMSSRLVDRMGAGPTPYSPIGDWRREYLMPFLALLFAIVTLELLIWIYVGLHNLVVNSKKK